MTKKKTKDKERIRHETLISSILNKPKRVAQDPYVRLTLEGSGLVRWIGFGSQVSDQCCVYMNGTYRLYDTQTGKPITTELFPYGEKFKPSPDPAMMPCGREAVFITKDRTAIVGKNLSQTSQLWILQPVGSGPQCPIRQVAVSITGIWAATIFGPQSITVWNIKEEAHTRTIKAGHEIFNALAFVGSHDYLLIAGRRTAPTTESEGETRTTSYPVLALWNFKDDNLLPFPGLQSFHKLCISHLAVARTPCYFSSADSEHVCVWDTSARTHVATVEEAGVAQMVWAHSDKWLVLRTVTGFCLVKWCTGEVVWRKIFQPDWEGLPFSMALSPDERTLAVGTNIAKVRLYQFNRLGSQVAYRHRWLMVRLRWLFLNGRCTAIEQPPPKKTPHKRPTKDLAQHLVTSSCSEGAFRTVVMFISQTE